MKCSNPECTTEAGKESNLCPRCQANINAFNAVPERNTSDEELLRFLSNHSHDLEDVSLTESRLIDDISEFGERELKPFERQMANSMMNRHRRKMAKWRSKT